MALEAPEVGVALPPICCNRIDYDGATRWPTEGRADGRFGTDSFAPDARQPVLPFARQASRAVIVSKLHEPRIRQKAAPGFEIVIYAVPPAAPALLVAAARVRAEQHASRLETCVELQQHMRQLLAGHMKQRRVGEHAIETVTRQIEL